MTLPRKQLVQARALLQDIRTYLQEWVTDSQPTLDYRIADVYRGLELTNKALTALIEDKDYTELLEFNAAFQKIWRDYAITDEEVKGE